MENVNKLIGHANMTGIVQPKCTQNLKKITSFSHKWTRSFVSSLGVF